MTEIANKVAVVTGGGSGIGRGLAVTLAQQGAMVVVADIIKKNAEQVADEINQKGGSAIGVVCDVCERAAVRLVKAEAEREFGRVSLLFANAGATSFEKLTDMSEDDVDWIFAVNLQGVTNCLMTFLPAMVAAGEGHVIATSSMAGLLPAWIPLHAPYSAAKMGVIGMMLNLRVELQEAGVGATVYCPGGVATGMGKNNASYRPERFGGPSTGVIKLPPNSPSKKIEFLAPEYVAKMVLHAVSENRAMVVDHPDQRSYFTDTYVTPVMSAFDEAEDFLSSVPP
jgi:NAD(P)-dependent dehydrogenase (short-subunit alcohol dehydrogenase family)